MLSVDNGAMSSTALANPRDVVRRVIWVQAITIGWMTVEAVFALGAAWRVHSPALLAFGGDGAIELLSAVVVYWRFRSKRSGEQTEQLAARITGVLLFALAAYVALVAALALVGHREVRPSFLGIAVLSVAAVVMPLLAQQKRRLSAATTSAALRADAAESALCGYLSIIALAGLVANAFWGITWAAVRGGPLLAYTARLVLSSWLRGLLSAPESAFLLSEVLMIRQSLDQCSPWHRPGIRRCIDPATVSPLLLCSDSRLG